MRGVVLTAFLFIVIFGLNITSFGEVYCNSQWLVASQYNFLWAHHKITHSMTMKGTTHCGASLGLCASSSVKEKGVRLQWSHLTQVPANLLCDVVNAPQLELPIVLVHYTYVAVLYSFNTCKFVSASLRCAIVVVQVHSSQTL